jgi:hypothetical protein
MTVSRVALVLVVLALLVGACGASEMSPSPGSGRVETAEAAVDAIRARVPLFDGIGPRDPELIGQAATWEAEATDAGWRVTFQVGWGDCQAGCIDRHTWTWDVAADGTVAFVAEDGSPLDDATLAALLAASTATGIAGRATGGPTCPVETPGDPSCAPRPVAGATLEVRNSTADVVATVATDGSGWYRIALTPGSYTLEPGPAEGFMSGPAPQPFTVNEGPETRLDLAYDTGIR